MFEPSIYANDAATASGQQQGSQALVVASITPFGSDIAGY